MTAVGEARLDELMPAFTELYIQWCGLKGYKLSKSPIVQMIDEATGAEKARMEEFSKWLVTDLLPRLAPTDNKSKEKNNPDDIFNKLNTLERLFYSAWLWNKGVYEKFDKAGAEWEKRGKLYRLFNPKPYAQRFMLMDYPAGGDTPRVEKLIKLTKSRGRTNG